MNEITMAALLQAEDLHYPVRIPESYIDVAKANGLVIVFGASDDLMELRGAIRDEIDCYEGGMAYLTEHGLLANDCDNDECPHFEKLKQTAATIEAIWCDERDEEDEDWTWSYKTDIPHATFGVMDDGERYCRGIVFRLSEAGYSA